MEDLRETAINHIAGEDFASLYTGERKWINYIRKLKEQYPDQVDIRHVNKDESLLVHIPAEWFKVKPKKKVSLTEEQIEAAKARLEKGRLKRMSDMEDSDAHEVTERN